MGCIMDTQPRVRARPRDKASPVQSPKSNNSGQIFDSQTLRNDFSTIMQGIQQMPKPDHTGPVVCFSELSLPLLIAPLSLEEGDSTGVTLPIIGISRHEMGRAAVFGNTQILMQCTRDNTDASAFLENIVKWASGVTKGRVSIAFVGYSQEITELLQKNVSGFGFRVVAMQKAENLEHFQVVICPSDYDDSDKTLLDFVESGGGLLCSLQQPSNMQNPERYKMNSTLMMCGLGFPATGLLAGPVNAPFTKVNSHISVLQKYTFQSLANSLKEVLKKNEIEISELDSCVTAVRYNVLCMPQSIDEGLIQLEKAAYDYLKEHNFITPEGYCPDIFHGVISVLVCEIQSKMLAPCFSGKDYSERFPGKSSEESDANDVVSVHLELSQEGWVSTGYWLAAGVVSTITTENLPPFPLVVQVGMHTEIMFSKEGPWKRWPLITNTFDLHETTEIANPYGGMIYVVLCHPMSEVCSLDLTIDRVFPYPRFSVFEPDLWPATKDRGAPWAEVVTHYVTFVAPAQTVRATKALSENAKMIDEVIETVLSFLGDSYAHSFRCVFDIEIIDEPICGYPIIMPLSACEALFSEIKPSEQLFVLTTFIAMLSLPEGAFDTNQESSLGCAATCAAFLKKWPTVSPLDFSKDMLPTHFNELWNIYKKDNGKALTAAMCKVRGIDTSTEDNCWSIFITEISELTGMDLG